MLLGFGYHSRECDTLNGFLVIIRERASKERLISDGATCRDMQYGVLEEYVSALVLASRMFDADRTITPAASDGSVHELSPVYRAEAKSELVEEATSLTDSWSVRVTPSNGGVTLLIEASGSPAWVKHLSPGGEQALHARALEVTATAWAAWHATGHAATHTHAMGILWLMGSGYEWKEAVGIAAGLVGS